MNNMKESIVIIGLGSLMCEKSARKTCPDLRNFHYVKLTGYKRIFNKTDSFLVRRGNITEDTTACACLSIVPDPEIKNMTVSSFEIPIKDWPALVYREFEYRLSYVPYLTFDGNIGTGIACFGDYKDDNECAIAMRVDPFRLQRWEEFQSLYKGPMWRYDLEPEPEYLKQCIKTVTNLGLDYLENFITTTFVGNGQSIKSYLEHKS